MTTTRIPLSPGHIDVDRIADHLEVTVSMGERTVFGIALTYDEADTLAGALSAGTRHGHMAEAVDAGLVGLDTVDDIWAASDETGIAAEAITAGMTEAARP